MSDKRTTFVSGARVGFGAAIARRFIERGDRVVVAARPADKLVALANEFGTDFGLPVVLDVRSRTVVEHRVASLPSDFAPVDILNNAGLALWSEPAPRADAAERERMIDTNCKGVAYLTAYCCPGWWSVARTRSQHRLGSWLVSLSQRKRYGATKAFVHQFSLNLRAGVQGTGVRVSCIEPR